jgi:hypothetical protein
MFSTDRRGDPKPEAFSRHEAGIHCGHAALALARKRANASGDPGLQWCEARAQRASASKTAFDGKQSAQGIRVWAQSQFASPEAADDWARIRQTCSEWCLASSRYQRLGAALVSFGRAFS